MADNMDSISCCICLDLLKDPVTIPCGHCYCMGCIKGFWDQDEQKGIFSCPLCKESFSPRPVLRKNTLLAELVEKLKKTGPQAAPPALCYAGPGDVACDVCTGRKQKAFQSCLVCLASYCETHLQPHYESPAFKKHKLVKASTQLQEKICSRHDKLLEVFCRTDQQCICYLCTLDEHKSHHTVSAAAERTDKQSQLGESQQKVQQRIQEREKELKEIQQAVKKYNHSSQTAVEDSERIFTELIQSIERRSSEVKKLIRAQQKAAVSRAGGLLERLEQEIAELRRRDAELEQLSHTEDHIHFLQSYVSLSSPSVSSDSPSFTVRPPPYFKTEAVSKLREKLEDILKREWTTMSSTVSSVDVLIPAKPQIRADFFQYSCQITLDPNTAHKHLSLSEGNRKVTCGPAQAYPYHPERFTCWCQVLCREGLSGRCYWEVEWSERGYIAVSYKDISRGSGRDSLFGFNNQSWGLDFSSGGYAFTHNDVGTPVSGPQCSRVGVYLDHRAGTLSFYSVSDTMTLLHRVHTTFTRPLYPGFNVWGDGSSVELCQLESTMADNMDSVSCCICLDLLKDPVTIPCGHCYCMGCIKGCWDQDEQKGFFSCPLCKESFTPRPVLRKNTLLAELVEKLKKTGLQAAPPALCYAGPGDVACDVCSGRKQKALQSCLVCLASYCETHLQPHYESPAFKKHKLVKASTRLQEKICSRHDKLLEVFCRTDQQCICYLCTLDEHKSHDTVSAAAERTDKQSQLGESQQKVQQRIQEREKELKEIQQAVKNYNHSAQTAVEDSERIFTELIQSIERRSSEVKELIRAQQRAAVSRAEGLLERLEQEIAELRRRDAELEQLSHTEDHIHFLQSYVSLSSPSVSSDSPSFTVRPPPYFKTEAVSKLREKLEDILKGEWTTMSSTVKSVNLLEPHTRADFFQYSSQLTLDPNTADKHLSLSEGNRKVTWGPTQSYPDHPERFTGWYQVLCKEGLSGRCYWEVEWSGADYIAVSYKDISRGSGGDSLFGFNNKSWRFHCFSGGYEFTHNDVGTPVSGPQSSRVGVYLDHRAGTLSFYSVSDTMNLLHRVHTTFTRPLYPGFNVGLGSSAELCQLE
ncbi:uncharacterized protein FYW47_008772 [Aplochiton taeniatus]